MPKCKAIKTFEMVCQSLPNMWYQIKVFDEHGKFIETFREPTMLETAAKVEAAGYHWLPED